MVVASLHALFLFASCVAIASAGGGSREMVFENRCKEAVWVGSQGSPTTVAGGGFLVLAGKKASVTVEEGWHGRFWGRTGCRFNKGGKGRCETGDCAGMALCGGAGATPPATLAEFSFGPPNDFYDVSLVDGFNIPLTITPSMTSAGARSHACRPASCAADLNPICPAPLRVLRRRRSSGEAAAAAPVVVACRSACNAFGKPQYCCTGSFSSPAVCRSSTFSRVFKRACPHAYTYAFDDPTSTFTCPSPRSYLITFC